MKFEFVFVSNYINHHQAPFCKAMCRSLKETFGPEATFRFVQTEPMEEERVRMGWQDEEKLPFVRYYYMEPENCGRLILEADVVLFGGTDEEAFIRPRLQAGKPVIRYSERLYKTGQWKAVSPRGLIKKYRDHTRYRKSPVFLLCSGAYVASDFHIVRAYPEKMFRWGYFPEFVPYDVDSLLEKKGTLTRILWAARFIDWKHPSLPVETAAWLKRKGCVFHMDIIGGGELESGVRQLAARLEVEDCVTFQGYKTPGEVRAFMEHSHIFLVTSDRQEGWGAVVNEAMNSGCAVVADHMVGAAPYLIRSGENGFVFRDGRPEELCERVGELCRDRELCGRLGRKAYETIAELWNPENAARCLLELCGRLGLLPEGEEGIPFPGSIREAGPCSSAPLLSGAAVSRQLG